MKIKKVLPVLALSLALVGCGNKAETTSNASSTPASTTTTEKADSNASSMEMNSNSASTMDSNASSNN
ncbi:MULTISPECIES: hypothetical protein [Anaerococcus]|uniref:hypothetical protein n=1 Tax=Anaerococcus TaxID=165779 RepID=UPI00242DDE63|nr:MULTISPECIES: hypothetical protein [Anaerococcus]MDD7766575.1 hypothetical protein [Anaerococcus vaginalis]MDY6126723.1 hypothetical protein [Anaerococcus sp.]